MIKSFITFISEGTKREKVLAFGRVNPVTAGHVKLFDAVKGIAAKRKADHEIILSHSHDKDKNPMHPKDKLTHARAASPGTNISVASHKSPTLLHHASDAHAKGYTHLTVVAGEDRVKEFSGLLNKYNGVKGPHGHYKFKKITVVSAGHRDPKATGVEGMSASKMRDLAKSGKHDEFVSNTPKGVDGHKMYSQVRKGLGLH